MNQFNLFDQNIDTFSTQHAQSMATQSPYGNSNDKNYYHDSLNYNNNSAMISETPSCSSSSSVGINRKKRVITADRFIPSRNQSQMNVSSYLLSNEGSSFSQNYADSRYSYLIAEGLVKNQASIKQDYSPPNLKINHFNSNSSTSSNNAAPLPEQISYIHNKTHKSYEDKKPKRTLPDAPEKILDAPDLCTDYYLNLLDWGDKNVLAVGLGCSVYLWNADNSEITQLLDFSESENKVCSLSWSSKSNSLAVGFDDQSIQIWDTNKSQLLRTMYGHSDRISSMSWNGCVLTTGSRDSNIINHDVRIQDDIIRTYAHHSGEVCGLKWSKNGGQLASGANDNNLMIWDLGYNSPIFTMREHKAAVKGLAWCPWQKNLLASGGGTHDKSIKFWNTDTGLLVNSLQTNSQICSLIWNKYDKELISAHGYCDRNQYEVKGSINVWRYPSLTSIGELSGHEGRVLHLAASPDGKTVVSAGQDETLRFWKAFNGPTKKLQEEKAKIMLDLR